MKNTVPSYAKYLFFLLLWVAVTFCIKSTKEPDIWWQVRTGEHIIENGSVPKVDVFSYSYDGDPWINVKWLTEVLMAFVSKLFGPELIYLLHALVLIGILLLFRRMRALFDPKGNPYSFAFLLASTIFLFIVSYRINGRPEMVSHLFTAAFLYIYLSYLKRPSSLIWVIVPLQLFWANMHEAYGVGLVISGLFFVTFMVEKIRARASFNKLYELVGVFVLSVLAVVVNPNGLELILHPINIFQQLKLNTFTTELSSFLEGDYWTLFSVLNILTFFLGLWKLFQLFGRRHNKGFKFNYLFLFYPVLFLAFFYLSLQSYRNIPFFQIIAFPAIFLFFRELKSSFFNGTSVYLVLTVFLLLLYVSIPTNTYYKTLDDRNRYGISLPPDRNPYSAAQFIEQNDLTGKCFSDYLSSSYLLWHLQPDFKTFLDLRDLDVFEAGFIRNNLMVYKNPEAIISGQNSPLWEAFRSYDNFSYTVTLNAEEFMPLNRYLFKNDDFELVYADQLNSIFVNKTIQENQKVLREKGYSVIGERVFQPLKKKEAPVLGQLFNYIFWPFYSEPTVNENVPGYQQFYFKSLKQ